MDRRDKAGQCIETDDPAMVEPYVRICRRDRCQAQLEEPNLRLHVQFPDAHVQTIFGHDPQNPNRLLQTCTCNGGCRNHQIFEYKLLCSNHMSMYENDASPNLSWRL